MSFENPTDPNNKNKVVSIERYKKENEKMLRAKEIMGEDFLGRREVEKALGIKIDPEKVPEIPFSEEDLQRAKKLGLFLILRVDKMANGKRLNIENISRLLKGKGRPGGRVLIQDNDNGGIFEEAWFSNEHFAIEEAPRVSWALTSRGLIYDSTGKDFIKQTEVIIDYLLNRFFKDREIPEKLRDAINEFDERKDDLEDLLRDCGTIDGQEKATKALVNLKITKITRPSPVEIVYDGCVLFQDTGEKMIGIDSSTSAVTSGIDSEGNFVRITNSEKRGMSFAQFPPNDYYYKIGTTISITDL